MSNTHLTNPKVLILKLFLNLLTYIYVCFCYLRKQWDLE